MSPLVRIVALWLVFGVVFFAAHAATDDCNDTPGNLIDPNDNNTIPNINSTDIIGICIEFHILRDVIPQDQLLAITRRHYRRDAQFRQAVRFMQSIEFLDLSEQLERTAFFLQIITQFENAGVDTTEISSITSILDCLLLPADMEDGGDAMNMNAVGMQSRSLSTYATELLHAIPRARFQQALGKAIATNKDFAAFYRVMRSPSFQRSVQRGLRSREMSSITRTLERNNINLSRLFSTVFRLFSWGPRPF